MRDFEARSLKYGRSLCAEALRGMMADVGRKEATLSPGLQRYFDKIVMETVRDRRSMRRDSPWLEALVSRWGLVYRVANERTYEMSHGRSSYVYAVRLRPRAWERASPSVQAICRLGAAENASEDPYALR